MLALQRSEGLGRQIYRSVGHRCSPEPAHIFLEFVLIVSRHIPLKCRWHECRRHQAYRASGDVYRDRAARLIVGEECCGDQRRGAAGNHRCQLIAERRTAVAQPGSKRFRDQRGLRPVLHVVRDQRQYDRDEHRGGYRGVYHAKIQEPEQPVAAPIRYIFLGPIRSEMCPNSGMLTNETQDATRTAVRIRLRDICRVPTA